MGPRSIQIRSPPHRGSFSCHRSRGCSKMKSPCLKSAIGGSAQRGIGTLVTPAGSSRLGHSRAWGPARSHFSWGPGCTSWGHRSTCAGLRTCSVFSKPCATSPSVRWVGSRETVGAICYVPLDNFARKWEDFLLQMSPQWPRSLDSND